MTRVLLLSSLFPPEHSGGVRRVAAFAGHLERRGFVVETMAGGGAPSIRYRSVADGAKSVAQRLKLGRLWRTANQWLALPDAKIIDVPRILVRRMPKPEV